MSDEIKMASPFSIKIMLDHHYRKFDQEFPVDGSDAWISQIKGLESLGMIEGAMGEKPKITIKGQDYIRRLREVQFTDRGVFKSPDY